MLTESIGFLMVCPTGFVQFEQLLVSFATFFFPASEASSCLLGSRDGIVPSPSFGVGGGQGSNHKSPRILS